MDRFIGICNKEKLKCIHYLKSNMDRFIDFPLLIPYANEIYLKSNMDRFIVQYFYIIFAVAELFKIQYG